MIRVENLRKSYGELIAVAGISFEVRSGEVLGLLGPNGAGKSTALSCICGLVAPSGGRVGVLGHDVLREPAEAKARLGVVPQELALYEDLSARQNLRYWGGAYGLGGAELRRRVEEVLEAVGLADRAREPVKRFSGGMKRRLNFGCAIVHRPRAILLDEPTVGVDPQSRARLLELVRTQARGGAAVLYTTHYMEEAQELCDRIAILDRGRLVAEGTLAELRARVGERELLRFAGRFDPAAARTALAGFEGLEVMSASDAELLLAAPRASRQLPEILAALARSGAEISETSWSPPSLESLFLALTGRALRE